MTDDFSRKPEVEILKSTSAKSVIPHDIPVHPVPSDEDQPSPSIEVAEAAEPVGPAGPPSVVIVPVYPDEARAVVPLEPVEPVELPALPRSARARRVPDHFIDYVTKCFVNIVDYLFYCVNISMSMVLGPCVN